MAEVEKNGGRTHYISKPHSANARAWFLRSLDTNRCQNIQIYRDNKMNIGRKERYGFLSCPTQKIMIPSTNDRDVFTKACAVYTRWGGQNIDLQDDIR